MPETPSILAPKHEPPHKARIRRVAKKVLEGAGKVSVSKAMREEGFTEAMAKNPQKLTATKTFKEILAEYVPETKIAEVIKEQLEATDVRFAGEQRIETPDNQARLKAVDIALKVTGGYAAEKHTNLNMNFSLAELRKMRDAGEI